MRCDIDLFDEPQMNKHRAKRRASHTSFCEPSKNKIIMRNPMNNLMRSLQGLDHKIYILLKNENQVLLSQCWAPVNKHRENKQRYYNWGWGPNEVRK